MFLSLLMEYILISYVYERQMSTTNISNNQCHSYSGNCLTWINALRSCQMLLVFPELFIQSVHFWQADLKHDNGSGLVIHQHASAAVPFHPHVQFHRHTHHGDAPHYRKMFNTENHFHTENNGFIIICCTFRRSALFSSCKEQTGASPLCPLRSLPTHRASAYTCKWMQKKPDRSVTYPAAEEANNMSTVLPEGS